MSKKNQLFRINPDLPIILSLLDAFGLDDIEDTRFFTKQHMIEIETVQKITKLKNTLENYYLPCKSKDYLNNITEKRCITILRQFIKIFNYKCIGIEKSIQGKKCITYRLIYDNSDQLSPVKAKEKRPYILTFEM
jgi:hypothetical protein